jgi:hypothetical protein
MVGRLAVVAVLAVAVAMLACGKTTVSPEPPIAWYTRIAPACAAAKRQNRPLLFINWASWDVLSMDLDANTFSNEHVREAFRRDWVALKVDRTDVYMNEGTGSEPEREVDEARQRFKPWASKYATVVLMAPDCTTQIGRVDGNYDPVPFLAQLAAARAKVTD